MPHEPRLHLPDLTDATGWPAALSEPHRLYLASRGVSAQVAAGRGYLTVNHKAGSAGNNLSAYGWGANHPLKEQINKRAKAAAIIIPLYHYDASEPSTYQARPDCPRIKTGRKLKYELPHGVKRGIEHGNLPADVHPFAAADVEDMGVPMIVTEGIPKADSLLSAAMAEGIRIIPVALTGVTMGYEATATAESQQTVERRVIEDLRRICDGRETVYLCWDSDWADKKQVRNSLARTGELLLIAGVEEVIYLGVPKPDADAEDAPDKAGVDDWLAQGHTLADLIANKRMPAPALDAAGDNEIPESIRGKGIQASKDDRELWCYEMRSLPGYPKPVLVREVKLGAIVRIEQIIASRRIVGHTLKSDSDSYSLLVDWYDETRRGRVPQTVRIETPISGFDNVGKWLDSDPMTSLIHRPESRVDEVAVANAIRARSTYLSVEHVSTTQTTGWYLSDGSGSAPSISQSNQDGADQESGGGEPNGWRYIHGQGWIGSVADPTRPEGAHPYRSTSATVETGSNAQMCDIIITDDPVADRAEWVQWFNDWVMGGVTDTLQASHANCKLLTKADQVHAAALRSRMAFGALVVARSLLPGAPAKGTPFIEGRPASGKTLQARVWTSCFGPFFGEKPFASLNSTAAGVEVMLTDARNMTVLVDDFHPGTKRDMETMNKIVDTIARGAYDGAVKARSTRDLKTLAAPQIAGSIVLTGEELPNQSSASNSTIQRLLVMRVKAATEPIYEMMNELTNRTVPQRTATGFMVAELARRLNAASLTPGSDSFHGVTPDTAIERVVAELQAGTKSLWDATISRTVTENASAPSDRSIMAVQDLLLGGALILSMGRQLGVLDTPLKFNAAIQALASSAATVLAETARAVSDSSPSRNVAELITAALMSGRGHVTNVQGSPPTDSGALSWGYSRQPDSSWRGSGERFGWVLMHEGEPVVALMVTPLAAALRLVTGSPDFTRGRVPQMLAEAIDEDARPILARGSDAQSPVVRIKVNRHFQPFLLVRPEAIGVDTSSLTDDDDSEARAAAARAARTR